MRVFRGRPVHPQDNGAHKRIQLDMRYEIEDAGADGKVAQQQRLDVWGEEFNHVRPHEALGMQVPASLYTPSSRLFTGVVYGAAMRATRQRFGKNALP